MPKSDTDETKSSSRLAILLARSIMVRTDMRSSAVRLPLLPTSFRRASDDARSADDACAASVSPGGRDDNAAGVDVDDDDDDDDDEECTPTLE